MVTAQQGDILKVNGITFPVLVVSNNLFSCSGKVIACPIAENAVAGPLHIQVKTPAVSGFVICEQVKYLDLASRHFSKCDAVPFFEMMDISDAIQGIFEY